MDTQHDRSTFKNIGPGEVTLWQDVLGLGPRPSFTLGLDSFCSFMTRRDSEHEGACVEPKKDLDSFCQTYTLSTYCL